MFGSTLYIHGTLPHATKISGSGKSISVYYRAPCLGAGVVNIRTFDPTLQMNCSETLLNFQ